MHLYASDFNQFDTWPAEPFGSAGHILGMTILVAVLFFAAVSVSTGAVFLLIP